ADGLQRLSSRVSTASDDTNELLQYLAESGVEIPDSPYIRFGLESADMVGAAIERAITQGRVSEAEIFSEHYIPIAGTNPLQFSHPAQQVMMPAAREQQEKSRGLKGFFGMTFTDRNAFGAV